MKRLLLLSMILLIGVILSGCERQSPKIPGNVCTLEYAPVCGVDGITYGNKCMAGNTSIAHQGECYKNYSVAKVLNQTCSQDSECETPGEYLVRSNCPYTSKCLDGLCTVVCPQFNGTQYPDVKECGQCPVLAPVSPEFCKDGKIIAGKTNECGCQSAPSCEVLPKNISPNTSSVQVVNPASEFCIEHGGEWSVKTSPDGSQAGYCLLNQVECDEWTLYRGECKGLHICTEDERNAQACTLEYAPVCGANGQTYGNKCEACSNGVEYWMPGECQ